MIEALKHFFGLCGDGHPSLLYMCGLAPFFLLFKSTIKLYYNLTISYLKNSLRRFQ